MSTDNKPLLVTFFPTQQALSKSERKITLEELAELIRQTHAPTKIELPWFKLGFFGGTAVPGYVYANGTTIGNASSSATQRANTHSIKGN